MRGRRMFGLSAACLHRGRTLVAFLPSVLQRSLLLLRMVPVERWFPLREAAPVALQVVAAEATTRTMAATRTLLSTLVSTSSAASCSCSGASQAMGHRPIRSRPRRHSTLSTLGIGGIAKGGRGGVAAEAEVDAVEIDRSRQMITMVKALFFDQPLYGRDEPSSPCSQRSTPDSYSQPPSPG